jgi:UDPglucose--hexose-1-phosphate uridylyltransferase
MDTPLLPGPHRRRDPLSGTWTLVSAERTQRPWQGSTESSAVESRPRHDPDCYLCPGNERASGKRNPDYASTYAFTNDFPALQPDTEQRSFDAHPLLTAETQRGTCRVLCFSPRHDLALAVMEPEQIRAVVDLWIEQYEELSAAYSWVQIFENRGESMGASNPHPHGQVWASDIVPTLVASEDRNQLDYAKQVGAPLLLDYTELELKRDERVVAANDRWLAVVPFWAVWPFETMVLPRRKISSLVALDDEDRQLLAALLGDLLPRYDNVFDHPFPYSMGWHGAPSDGSDGSHWYLHAHFYPPLLRSPTIRKWMVGYEMLAEQQRDVTPETAAQRLREVGSARRPTWGH